MKVVMYVCNKCGIEIDKGHWICEECHKKSRREYSRKYHRKNKSRIRLYNYEKWQKIKKDPKKHKIYLKKNRKYYYDNRRKILSRQRDLKQQEIMERERYKQEAHEEIFNKVKREVLKL